MDEQAKVKDVLIRQQAYFQYLFELEQKRAASIVGGAKVYIAFIVFIFGSIFLKVLNPEKILIIFADSTVGSTAKSIVATLVISATLSLTASIAFTFMVMKVWLYDWLCDPIERLKDTLAMENELEVLSKSITDFVVATSRNNRINNKRVKYLTRGLNCLLLGTLLSIIAVFTLTLLR